MNTFDTQNDSLKKELSSYDEFLKADDLRDNFDTGLYDCCRDELSELDEYFFVKKSGLWGLINDKCQTIMPCVLDCDEIAGIVRPVPVVYNNYDNDYEEDEEDEEDYFFMIARKNDFWGCVGKNGKEIIPFTFDSIDIHFAIEFYEQKQMDVYFFVTKDGKIGLWNSSGKELTPAVYNEIIPNDSTSPDDIISSFTVRLGNKWGILSLDGKVIIPCQFDEIEPYHNLDSETERERPPRFCSCKRGGKWGSFNEAGDMIIPFDYEEIGLFNYLGIVDVRLNGKAGCINSKNEIIIPIQYDNVIIDSEGDYIGVELDGKWGIWEVHDGNAIEKLPFILDNLEGEYNDYSQQCLYTTLEGERLEIDGALLDRLEEKIKN